MKKRKLGTKVIILMVVFSLLIIVSTCIAVVVRYREDALERSRGQAFAYAKTAAAYIDGDRIEGYLTTLQKDEYYEQVENFLNANQDYSDLKYYYVYVPYEDDLVYIWDANEEEGACELGDHEDYMKGGKEVSFAAFQKEPEERALVSMDETYGFITSVVAPVYNSNGDPVALVGVDISMPGVWQSIAKFIFATSINIVLVILVFSAGLFAVVRQRLIHPIRAAISTALPSSAPERYSGLMYIQGMSLKSLPDPLRRCMRKSGTTSAGFPRSLPRRRESVQSFL